jgi:hypoxanthine phosphoribosyltransferase
MRLDKCHCEGAGFCEIYQKQMDDNGIKWCKESTQEKRENYFVNNGGKLNETQEEIAQKIETGTFISNERLTTDCLSLIEKLPPIEGVIGIPRSGMIPASIIAVNMSVPLYSISDEKLVVLNSMSDKGGSRMEVYKPNGSKNILLIDDTAFFGNAMSKHKELVEKLLPSKNIITSVIYSTPEAIEQKLIDIHLYTSKFPHVLEWNFFDAHPTLNGMFDLDGVFCEDCPYEIAEDETRYKNWIKTVKPIENRIPRLFPAIAICTGRLEKYRKETEEWLDRHNIKYSNLLMFQGTKEERDSNHVLNVARFKLQKFIEYNKNSKGLLFNIKDTGKCLYFIESCPEQSRLIADGKPNPGHTWVVSINEGLTL